MSSFFQPKKFDAATVILGFTGPPGSGCTYISQTLPEIIAGKKYKYFSLSSVIKDKLNEDGNPNPSVKQKQDKGNEMRRTLGRGHIVHELLKRIDDGWKDPDYGIVIDGIKNEGELLVLRNFPNFLLFSVQADRETRSRRVIKDGKMTAEEFDESDKRDAWEDLPHGQQVKRCNYLSDVIIINNTQIPPASQKKKREFLLTIYEKYVKLVENLKDDTLSAETSPTIDELCMTVAYSLSKKSSCLKRKVGALIVDIDQVANGQDQDGVRHLAMPTIVSSGFNEVPIGSHKCVFHPDFGMCYRDHLQEEFGEKLKFCPSCGKAIAISITCPNCGEAYSEFVKMCRVCHKEVETVLECPTCQVKIFDTFIPGSKDSPGKLLDMCRALHAEEISLLNLGRRGGKSNDNLVLYITTQPCNLCSNKIVAAGIKSVVFDDPYSMKEAQNILDNAHVKTRRFQGIKSSAYFRLYR